MAHRVITIHRPVNGRDQFTAQDLLPLDRSAVFHTAFETEMSAASIPEFVFHATNAPEPILDVEHFRFLSFWRKLKLFALSVGDIVEVDGQAWLCERCGWTEVKNAGWEKV